MRILHVTPSYFPAVSFGGPIQSVHLLNKTLASKGITVDVFTTNAGLKLQDNLPLKSWVIVDGVRVKYFPYMGYIHYNFSMSLFRQLLKDVKNYDLVHVTAVWNFPVIASALASIKNKRPYIISPRGTIYPETIAIKSSVLKKIYLQLFGNYCLNNASALHFTSLDEEEKVMKNLNLKAPSKVIPNGLDLRLKNNSFAEEDTSLIFRKNKYILFLGRINKKKGLDLLLNAFLKVNKLNPEIKLIIAGPDSDNYKQRLLRMVDELDIYRKVIFTGILNGKAKEEAYHNAIMFILPSYSENFGMSVAEAMFYKIPVIVTDKVGIYSLINEYKAGIVVSPDVESLSVAIESLIDNEELKKELVNNAIKLINSEFNIDSITDKFINFYQTVITSN